MTADERAIRDLVALWHSATSAGDVATVLGLMAEDVVFLVTGQPPMRGRAAFEKALRRLLGAHRLEATSEIQEIHVSGDLTYCWSVLAVKITPLSGGSTVSRSGNALSILRKAAGDRWVVARDANLMAVSA